MGRALKAEAAVEAAGAGGRVVGAGVVDQRQRRGLGVRARQHLHQLVDDPHLCGIAYVRGSAGDRNIRTPIAHAHLHEPDDVPEGVQTGFAIQVISYMEASGWQLFYGIG